MRLFLKTRAICMRTFFTFKSISSDSTCKKFLPSRFVLDVWPFTSATTPSSTASKSPAPLAGMINSTPELVYLAWMVNRGMVIFASNGLFPSISLEKFTCIRHIYSGQYKVWMMRLLDWFHREITGAKDFHVLQVDTIALWSASQLQWQWVHQKWLHRWHLMVKWEKKKTCENDFYWTIKC